MTTGQYVVFLDDDSYPDAASIGKMIDHFRGDPSLGAAIFNVHLPDGSRECSAFPAVFIGCGTGFRREALIQTGGLPDDFFMQAEEYDLSLRLLDAGWNIGRFEDLRVTHLKTPSARQPTRTTRLDARNNFLVVSRRFPREYRRAYAVDWMRRYHWMAQTKPWPHRFAFWQGLVEGIAKSLLPGKRREISQGAFEKFAMIDEIQCRMATVARDRNLHRVLLVDVGKNIYAFWRAARALNLQIVAVADANLAKPGRRYQGIPVIDDSAARELQFDAAILTNISPVHSIIRRDQWCMNGPCPALDLFETPSGVSVAA